MNLTDLAKELNLSVSTVSRALSRPDLVSDTTRERVLMAAEHYGYRPNGIARSLRKGRTQTIGLVVSDIQNPFYSAITRAVERVVAKHGYSLVICNADEDAASEGQALMLLHEMQAAGIIHSPTSANIEALQRLSAGGVPIVDIDRVSGLKNADTVLVDNKLGAKLAAEHLLELGHTHIAIIAGPAHLTTGRDRSEGFREALEAAGLNLDRSYCKLGDFKEASGYQATLELLRQARPPTALFVANNEMAAGALAAIRECHVTVPERLSVISFDDVRWAKYVEPPLTVIAQPVEEMGTLAAQLLFERFEGRREPVACVLTPILVRRESCVPFREATDSDVS